VFHCYSATQPERRTSFDQQLVGSLEKQLGSRPKKDELVDRNILKGIINPDLQIHRTWLIRHIVTDDSVAPALQAAKERLQRSQLEVRLDFDA
jgi:hypothetical protein